MKGKTLTQAQLDRRGFIKRMIMTAAAALTLVFAVSQYKMLGGLLAECIILLAVAFVFIWLPWDRFQDRIDMRRMKAGKKAFDLNKCVLRVCFFISPVMAFWIVEKTSGNTLRFMVELVTEHQFRLGLNGIIYITVWLVLYAIFDKVRISAFLVCLFGFIFSYANFLVLTFRGYQIVASDFSALGTAADVVGGYAATWDKSCIVGLVWLMMFSIILFSFKNYKGMKWKGRLVIVAAALVFVFASRYVYFTGKVYKGHAGVSLWNPARNYTKNGSVASFFMTWSYITVDKPDGYSVQAVKELAENYTSDDVSQTASEKSPNVIVIMNESFADLNVDGELPLNEDYMPFIHSLTENTIKGHLHMSVFGGQTANSEFEFLTGNSMAFLPFRSIPYNNFISAKTESLTYTLENQGYGGNIAFHPYRADTWNRPAVYPLLGFSDYLSQNDVSDAKKIRSFISDESDYKQIAEEYEKYKKDSDAPFYMFNVTVQNHGGYTDSSGVVDNGIKFTDTALNDEGALNYVNLAKASDSALEWLVDYFKNVDEPTVIVFFGDHQPKLGSNFYKYEFGTTYANLSLEQTAKTYETQYLIWANYDIGEKSDFDMSANYLRPYVLDLIGAKMTGYDKYLLDLQKKIPVFSTACYIGSDGKLKSTSNYKKDTEYGDIINDYYILEYNDLFDTKNTLNSFFYLKGADK